MNLQGEEQIIQTHLRPLAEGWPGAFGLQDDCATVLPAPGHELVVKTDPIRAGVHFLADDAPSDIAWKALAVNVSDLAAKAARPLAYTLAISLPAAPSQAWIEAFAGGLAEAQRAFGCHLIGGDTDRADGPMSLAVTVFGECPVGRMVRRAMPQVGDRVFVSGTLGDAALGLQVRLGQAPAGLGKDHADAALRRYLRPRPRIGLLRALRGYANAAMDLSDGLSKDLGRMCRAGNVGARVNLHAVPMSEAVLAACGGERLAARALVSSGDDYEVLSAVPVENGDKFVACAQAAGIPVTQIGAITKPGRVSLFDNRDAEVDWGAAGYDHF